MAKKTLILLYKKDLYFFPRIDNIYNIENSFTDRKKGFFLYLFKLLFKFKLPGKFLFLGNWKRNINDMEKVIVFDSGYSPVITNYIKKKNPKCIIHLYLFNTISNEKKYLLNDKNIDRFWSFDKNDVKKYGINYNSTTYSKNITLDHENIEYDIVFLGTTKQRKEQICDFQKSCDNLRLKTLFCVIESQKDFIDYNTYLELVDKSKCILDITNSYQEGLTLRFMESLFFEKKIITNNKSIKGYDFYDKTNIFILGEDDIGKLSDFLSSDYRKIDKKIVDYYEFNQWIKRFI
ncbi:hypothetical protein [Breznakia pachnodae]|uniref:Uncharacterized protein n=1 Tax=Breznakia pachnodae TaxID=265178 RepID=A0ABU0DYV3_9FIRM|nr:hypothetical protein [Breznakia pachnodae]MDQ0359812.1 hypothetical protein [Breznakia pachnodae]